ncbi:unnamed protein product [Ectocarpus sp. CCAP 1310/34]|nr:unnamed protein product [Ectocarpus sp. CCAP 1310/34]
MRKANAYATAPVVYPGCSGPSSEASGGFQQPAPGRVKKAQASHSSQENGPGSSGEESGWSSAGASRRPPEPSSSSVGGSPERKVATRSVDGARGPKGKSGSWSGSDTSLSRKPGRQRQVKKLGRRRHWTKSFQMLLRHLA